MDKIDIASVIGRTITNIYIVSTTERHEYMSLDTSYCSIELDNETIIGIPYGFSSDLNVGDLSPEAESLFADLSDIPTYNIQVKLGKYHTELSHYEENKLKYLKDQKIIDYLWYDDDNCRFSDKGYFLLENGYVITETTCAPHGLGKAGLTYFQSIDDFKQSQGEEYKSLVSGDSLNAESL